MSSAVQSIFTALTQRKHSSTSDGELLNRFVKHQDESAFAELLQRHSAMVFAVARRCMGTATDAEDVYQATFLLLARKAPRLWRHRSLAGWLYGVARRMAADLRRQQRRRQRREDAVSSERLNQAPSHWGEQLLVSQETLQLLDTELARLPRHLREPLLLHCLQGISHQEVAQRLGIAPGTVGSRLNRAKALLKQRLIKRGVESALIMSLFSGVAQARLVPTPISHATAVAALQHSSQLASLIPSGAASLFSGELHLMFMSKLKLVAAGLLAATGITLASTNWSVAAAPAVPLASLPQGANPTGSSTRQDAEQEKLQGTWYCIAIIGGGSKQPPADVMEAMKQVQLIFKGDQVTLKNAPNGDKGNTYRLDSSTTPKRLTMVNDGRTVMNAVYALEGDVLILTFREGSSEFPSSLAVTRDLQGGMMVLQKTPLFPPNPEAVKNMKAMSNKVLAQNSMRQIGLAVHIYADKFNKLPRNITNGNGKPLLSWRVALLPYLEAEDLYRKFKLDEPWDSEHNRKLIPMMPKYFSISDADMKSHTTPFRSFIGNGAVMEHEKDVRFADIKDGTSNTILFVEAREAVIWTKPDDLEFIPNKPLPKLGGRYGNQFLIVMCDGSSHSLLNTIGDDNLKALITRAGNEEINLQTLQGEAKPPVKP